MDYYSKINERVKEKLFWMYATIGLASVVFMGKLIFGRGKALSQDSKIKKRRKIANRIKRLFDINHDDTENSKIQIINRNDTEKELKFAKLKAFTDIMMNKGIDKQKVQNPNVKKDYIFYQILSGMDQRFKHGETQSKSILN